VSKARTETWLVCDNMAGHKWDIAGEAMRAFVYAQKRAKAMASAMLQKTGKSQLGQELLLLTSRIIHTL
jgi:hypothetical protein